jgi:hypothetical protein
MFEEGSKAALSFPGSMELCFVSIKTGTPLIFRMTTESSNNVTIWCDDMEVLAEVVQDLCGKLGVRAPQNLPLHFSRTRAPPLHRASY